MVVLVMVGAGASSASAVIAKLANGRTLSYWPTRGAATTTPLNVSPFDEVFSNLDYNGGPVMASNTNYTVYWDPSTGPAYPPDYRRGLNRYFGDLAHDSGGQKNVDSVSSQYNDAAGEFANYNSHFGGALIDPHLYPANGCKRATICLTDRQLRTELTRYTASHSLPTDLTHEYFLLTPPGVESCFEASGEECSAGTTVPVYCAYHGDIPVAGGEIVYAEDPYVTGNPGCDDGNHPNGPSDGALQGGISHEHNESITDPEPELGNAWTDFGGLGGEIGDKCRTFQKPSEFGTPLGIAPDGAKYNQVINGHLYWYQKEWSNDGRRCMQRLTFSGAEPTATFASTPAGGNRIMFDAAGSTAPGGVAEYNWQFNDAHGPSIPIEATTPTVTHRFPARETFLVALTVFAADGTSIGTAHTIKVGKAVAPTVTNLSPTQGAAAGGTKVTVTGSGFALGETATAFRFGVTRASTVSCGSTTECTVVAPAHARGTAQVTATVGEVSSQKQPPADQFTYQ